MYTHFEPVGRYGTTVFTPQSEKDRNALARQYPENAPPGVVLKYERVPEKRNDDGTLLHGAGVKLWIDAPQADPQAAEAKVGEPKHAKDYDHMTDEQLKARAISMGAVVEAHETPASLKRKIQAKSN